MLIGRSPLSSQSTDYDNKEITIDSVLPVSMTFEEITTLNLDNPHIAKITGTLIFHPYYIFDNKLDSTKNGQKK